MPVPVADAGVITELAMRLKEKRSLEQGRLIELSKYYSNNLELTFLPRDLPREIQALASISRLNFMKFIVDSAAQSSFVDAYMNENDPEGVLWREIWQRNKMDRKQVGIHRSVSKYGLGFSALLPFEIPLTMNENFVESAFPIARTLSPMNFTAVYQPGRWDWPIAAMEWLTDFHDSKAVGIYYDQFVVARVEFEGDRSVQITHLAEHGAEIDGMPVTPIVRYRSTEDLDDPVVGDIEPNRTLQDVINVTTFALLLAQHYGAHGQRMIISAVIEDMEKLTRSSANKVIGVPAEPDEVRVQEFRQTQLDGYIDSREAAIRHLSVLSQTPANELVGQLVNLSAEAIDAANEASDKKNTERDVVVGEGHEQFFALGASYLGIQQDFNAEVKWRETRIRAFQKIVDTLAVIAEKLNVPPELLWDMIPGVTQNRIEMWRDSISEREIENVGTDTGINSDSEGIGGEPTGEPVGIASDTG